MPEFIIADLKDDGSWRYVAWIEQHNDTYTSEWVEKRSSAMKFLNYREAKTMAFELSATVQEV